jgi:Zn-dependent protease with chaperone function
MSGARDAVRALRASPTVTGLAILSLALGIGANTAMFSIVDALVLRDLPVRDANRLAMLFDDVNGASFWSHPIWESVKSRPTLFDGSFAFSGWRFNLAESGEVDPADGLWVRVSSGRLSDLGRRFSDVVMGVNAGLTTSVRPYREIVSASIVRERLVARLSAFFGVLALLLAALGLYGVTSYSVNQRRTELGIRMALGTTPGNIVRLIVSRVSALVAAGLFVGGVVSWWLSCFIAGMLFSLPPRDVPTTLAAALLPVSVAFLAAWTPARRAARIDPAGVLRDS